MSGMPAKELLHFIKNSPTCYHVTENIREVINDSDCDKF